MSSLPKVEAHGVGLPTRKALALLGPFLALMSLLSSNLSAMISWVWLVPGLVYFETFWWLILALLAIWMLRRNNDLSPLWVGLARNWIILPFLAFSGFSVLWSVFWQVSLSRWLILGATVIVGASIGIRLSVRQIVRLLSIFGGLVLVLSGAVILLAPRYGIMNYYDIQGAWKGLFWHKNHMGLIAAFFVIVFLIELIGAMQSRAKSVGLWGILYLISLVFTYKTDSVAAYLVVIILHAAILLFLVYLRVRAGLHAYHYGVLLAIAALTLIALYSNMDRVLGAFNRNPTLTGRVPMWGHLFDIYVSKRPISGYGFNAFWYIEAHRITMQQVAGYPDQIVISDNGFIDILVNTGYLGLALFLVFYAGLWGRSIVRALVVTGVDGLFPLILMAYTLLANVTWSLLFENESFFMLTMIAIMFALSRRPSPAGTWPAAAA